MRRTLRNLLHNNKLLPFVNWAKTKGWKEEPISGHQYEVARLSFGDRLVIIYEREHGEHLTTSGEGSELVRQWLDQKKGTYNASPVRFPGY